MYAYNEIPDKTTLESLGINPIVVADHKCIYCGTMMDSKPISDLWDHGPKDYSKAYYETIDLNWTQNEAGAPLKELILEDSDTQNCVYCSSSVCKSCGWWFLGKTVMLKSLSTQMWQLTYLSSGILNSLDLTDLSVPISEIRKYLCAKYDDRFNLHPRIYEKVVAGVFKDLGYYTFVTAYTSDGGIDVILYNPKNDLVGVQVRRSKNNLEVEQIRSLIGALVVNNYTKGIFVTTTDFQRGAYKLTHRISKRYAIELYNAEKFYEALKIAQLNTIPETYPFDIFERTPKLYPVLNIHLNSL